MLLGKVAKMHRGVTERQPAKLSFSIAANSAYFNINPSSLVDFTEAFTSTAGFTEYTEGTAGTTTASGGTCTIAHSGSQNDIITETSSVFSMPQLFIPITVSSVSGNPSGYDNSGVGIVKDQNNFLFASIDRLNSIARIQIKIAGVNTFLASVTKTWTAPFTFALSLVGNSVALWQYTGGQWVYVTGADVSGYYNFCTAGNLTGWKAGFTLANGGSSTWNFTNFSAGRFGAVGLRDMTIVTNEDGTAYISSGTAYFTATAVDPRGVGYCGVFSLNLSTFAVAQQGVIMVSRDGGVWNDLSAHLIYYDNGNRRLLIGTWGNGFGGAIHTLHGLLATDILVGTNVVSGLTQLVLPQATGSNPGEYDAMMVYDAKRSRWLIAYTAVQNTNFSGNPFFAYAAYSLDLTTWTLVGADTVNGYEGTKILALAGDYWIAAGGPAGSGNSSRVFDAAMTYVGALSATFSGGADTQPHPMVFAAGSTAYLLTFDNTKFGTTAFTWGKPILETAARYF